MGNAGELFGQGSEKQQLQYEHKTGKPYEEIGRLKVEVDWLKKDRTSGLTTEEKRQMIEPTHPELSIKRPVPTIEPHPLHLLCIVCYRRTK